MSEASPSKKSHPYGRRNRRISNTAEQGELCLYSGHGMGRFSSHSMRYESHQACTRCVAGAREGRLSFNIDGLLKKHRQRALKFWSQVDIAAPDECWNWHGCINSRTHQPQFSWRRPGISTSTQHHPQRVAMWFSWGDLGYTGVKTTCGNKYCCNPFHLIPQNIGVFVDDDSYIDSFELACQIHTLKQQVQEYLVEQAFAEEAKQDQSLIIDERAELFLDNDASFNKRVQAVMHDILEGRHVSQADPEFPGLYRQLDVDNENDDDDNPTHEY
jgi:hypothetical protein